MANPIGCTAKPVVLRKAGVGGVNGEQLVPHGGKPAELGRRKTQVFATGGKLNGTNVSCGYSTFINFQNPNLTNGYWVLG
jgi:hypothetical protein